MGPPKESQDLYQDYRWDERLHLRLSRCRGRSDERQMTAIRQAEVKRMIWGRQRKQSRRQTEQQRQEPR